MKILFFSDIHGNIEAMNALCNRIEGERFDRIIFCGDAAGYGYHVNEVCEALIDLNVDFIRGNHDQIVIDIVDGRIAEEDAVRKYGASYMGIAQALTKKTINFMRNSLNKIELLEDGLHILAVHGSIDDYLNGRIYPDSQINDNEVYRDFDYIVEGHTHFRMVRKAGFAFIINPGSIGQPRDGNFPSFAIMDTVERKVVVNDLVYPIDTIVEEIICKESPMMANKMIEIWKRGNL